MADRYTYIPLIGIFIIVAWGVPELMSKWRYKEKVLSISVGIRGIFRAQVARYLIS